MWIASLESMEREVEMPVFEVLSSVVVTREPLASVTYIRLRLPVSEKYEVCELPLESIAVEEYLPRTGVESMVEIEITPLATEGIAVGDIVMFFVNTNSSTEYEIEGGGLMTVMLTKAVAELLAFEPVMVNMVRTNTVNGVPLMVPVDAFKTSPSGSDGETVNPPTVADVEKVCFKSLFDSS